MPWTRSREAGSHAAARSARKSAEAKPQPHRASGRGPDNPVRSAILYPRATFSRWPFGCPENKETPCSTGAFGQRLESGADKGRCCLQRCFRHRRGSRGGILDHGGRRRAGQREGRKHRAAAGIHRKEPREEVLHQGRRGEAPEPRHPRPRSLVRHFDGEGESEKNRTKREAARRSRSEKALALARRSGMSDEDLFAALRREAHRRGTSSTFCSSTGKLPLMGGASSSSGTRWGWRRRLSRRSCASRFPRSSRPSPRRRRRPGGLRRGTRCRLSSCRGRRDG